MQDDPQKWKITDGQKNVADLFDSKEDAQSYATWLTWKIKNSDLNGGASTITLKYKKREGGQALTKRSQFSGPAYSEHGGKDRCSLYSEPKNAFSATNAEIVGYVRMRLGAKDQILYKVLSGNHGEPSMAGRCYGCGFEIDGNETKLHAVKELDHPITPRITSKVQVLHTGSLPPLNGKTVGYRVNHWVNKDGHTEVEFDADFSVLDIAPRDLREAPNKWQPMFRFVDKGDWGLDDDNEKDANIKENSGITYHGRPMGYYFRADEVAEGDGSVSLEHAIEIEPPT
jgi:hypothetical protein